MYKYFFEINCHMARKTKAEAEQTRDEILEAALELFYQKGYSRTTFEDIAKKIGLTKGAIYWHFKNKPDLLAALMLLWDVERKALIEKNSATVTTLEDLKNCFVKAAQIIKNDIAYRKFLFFILFQMEWSEAIYNRIRNKIDSICDFPLQRLKETLTVIQKSGEIAQDINIEETSIILLSFWHGLVNGEIGGFQQLDFEKAVCRGFEMIIYGLKERS